VPLPSLALTFRAVLLLLAAVASVIVAARTQLAVPDLVLPVVVAGALRVGPSRGAMLGLAGGWLVDLMPPGSAVLGTAALLYAAAGLVAGAGRREGETPFGWVTTVGAACAVVVAAGRLVVAGLTGAPVDGRVMGAEVALTAVLCAVLVPLLVRCERRLAGGRRPAAGRR
jgi:rod shape-determining protein MreD